MNYLIVGVGNIGVEYANTRHNMGFMVLDAWAQASNIVFESGRYGYTATISFKGRKFTLLKPSTYIKTCSIIILQRNYFFSSVINITKLGSILP